MLLRSPWLIVALSCLAIPLPVAATEAQAMPGYITAAVADTRRPPEQIDRDSFRKPAQLIAFAGLKPGDKIADFMPGNAYFTRIFSDVVGRYGRVYAFLPTEQIANCSPEEIAGTRALIDDPGYGNVKVLTNAVARFRLPEKLDMVWTAQNYHDLHDAFMGPADLRKFNRSVFHALKPGGVFIVVDHAAEAGSGLRDTDTLHRIDPRSVRSEVEAAGFVLEAQSDLLHNTEDDHRRAVFDPLIRGRTDQIVYRFRRP